MRPTVFLSLVFACISFSVRSQSFHQQIVSDQDYLSSVFMVNATVGYAGGVDGVYKTIDGGETWQLTPFFEPSGIASQDYFTQYFNEVNLHFFNENNGIAYGRHVFDHELVMSTHDGGNTWTVEHFQTTSETSGSQNLNTLHTNDGINILIGANKGRILRSTDGGDTWSVQLLNEDKEDVLRVQFVTASKAYAVAGNQFYASDDGGSTWTSMNLPHGIRDFHFLNEESGVGISGGAFYTTTDAGETWTESFVGAQFPLYKLIFAGESTLYALGLDRYIYKSIDAGLTWQLIFSAENTITGAHALSPENIRFTTISGYLLHSENGGYIDFQEPSITSSSMYSGAIGSEFLLTVINSISVTGVKINGLPASFRLHDGLIKTKIPRTANTGKIELIWSGGSVFSSFDFQVSEKPIIYLPASGKIVRGNVALEGENLLSATRMTLNGYEWEYTITDNEHISFEVPQIFPHPLNMILYSPHGNLERELPEWGAPGSFLLVDQNGFAGKKVRLSSIGSTFYDITSVKFGGVKAKCSLLNHDLIECTVPDLDAGVVKVSLETEAWTAYARTEFTVYETPLISSVSPTTLKIGEDLKLVGDFFPLLYGHQIFIGNKQISTNDVRFIDRQTMYIKMPVLYLTGTPITIKVQNEGGAIGSITVPLTISGKLPATINSVFPIRASYNRFVSITGNFDKVDSLTVNGVKQILETNQDNYIGFRVASGTTSGTVTIYHGEEATSYSEDLIVTENESPSFTFSPQRATVGSRIFLDTQDTRFITAVKINQKYVPFTESNPDPYITILDGTTSGPITLITTDGEFTSATPLTIINVNDSKPVIYGTLPGDEYEGYFLKLYGHNFTQTTGVRMDNQYINYEVIHEDTLILKYPSNVAEIYLQSSLVHVESAHGFSSIYYSHTSGPSQLISSVSPLIARRGDVITITLTEPSMYYDYPYNYRFFFGRTEAVNVLKQNETTFLVEVPVDGDVNGRIGLKSPGILLYSDIEFTEDVSITYCSPTVTNTQGVITRTMVQGKYEAMSTEPYVDNTSEPIEVVRERLLRLGVAHSEGSWKGRIYLDWNGDFEFNETPIDITPGLELAQDTMVYVNVVVPDDAFVNGNVRMRMVATSNMTEIVPCGSFSGTHIADYTLHIKDADEILKVADFFPTIGNSNTIITITGENFDEVVDVKIDDTPFEILSQNEHTLKVQVPSDVATGPITIYSLSSEGAVQMVSTSVFTVDTSILPPDHYQNNFELTYSATINGEEVPFFMKEFLGATSAYIIPQTPQRGEICYHTPGGSYCEVQQAFPFITNPEPIAAIENEEVFLTGYNLENIISLSSNEHSNIPFTFISRELVKFVAPVSDQPHLTLYIDTHSGIDTRTLSVQDAPPPNCDPLPELGDGLEITNLQLSNVTNTTGKNTTGKVIDFNDMPIILDQFHGYYSEINVKNFYNIPLDPHVDLYITEVDEPVALIPAKNVAAFSLSGHTLQPGEEMAVPFYLKVPDSLEIGTTYKLWVVALNVNSDPCNYVVTEIETYQFIVKDQSGMGSLTINDLSAETVKVGDIVHVNGTGFFNVKGVKVGNKFIPYVINSDSDLTFTAFEELPRGKVTVITTNDESSSLESLLVVPAPSIQALQPNYGKVGDIIRVSGSNFLHVNGVFFDNQPVGNFTIISDNLLQFKVDANAKTGSVNVANIVGDVESGETFYYCDGITPNSFCKVSQVVSFSPIGEHTYGDSAITLTAEASSSLPVTFTSSNNAVATVVGNVLTITGAGTATIAATQPGNNLYLPSQTSQIITVNKASQTITFNEIAPMTTIQSPAMLDATASSGLQVLYLSSDPSVAMITNNLLYVTGPGTTTVTAFQNGNSFYQPATSVYRVLVVEKTSQSIQFSPLGTVKFGEGPLNLSAIATSGNDVSYVSSNPDVATINGNKLMILKPGVSEITAIEYGNQTYQYAEAKHTLTVIKASQQIIFNELQPASINDESISLNSLSTASLPVTYSSSNPEVAIVVNNNSLQILSAGSTIITASQPGNDHYNAADDVARTFTVTKLNQFISFAPLDDVIYGQAESVLDASTNSGLPVTFSSSNPEVATVDGERLIISSAGTTTIIASQTGNNFYSPAAPVSQTLTVLRAPQSISFEPIEDQSLLSLPILLKGTSSSGLPVVFSVIEEHATVSGNLLNATGAGSITVSAMQAGDDNYAPAIPVSQTFCIIPSKPIITQEEQATGVIVLKSSSKNDNQWYLDGQLFATSETVTADIQGVYEVSVVADGCASEMSDKLHLLITSLEKVVDRIKFFPVPTNDRLYFVSDQHVNRVQMIKVDGTIIHMPVTRSGSFFEINVAGLSAGIYVIECFTENRLIARQKIVKE